MTPEATASPAGPLWPRVEATHAGADGDRPRDGLPGTRRLKLLALGLAGLLALALLMLSGAPAEAQAQQPAAAAESRMLQLDARTQSASGWDALRWLRMPAGGGRDAGPATAEEAWQQLGSFSVPDTPRGNLGPFKGSTWLHLPLQMAADAPSLWYLGLGYPVPHRVQVHVLDAQGRLLQTVELGSLIAHRERPLPTRDLVAPLRLQPGELQHVLLHIETPSAQILHPVLMQPGALVADENAQQAFQGVMTGLWLFMMLYSLVTGLHRRQAVFLAYAGALLASWLFSLGIYGHGAVWLWPHSGWLAGNITVLTPALMVAANAQFFIHSLHMPQQAPRVASALQAVSVTALAVALAFALGLLSYEPVAVLSMLLGVLHLLLVLPVAWVQHQGGDRSAGLVLLGCLGNLVGITVLSLLLRGHLPGNFATLHAAQFTFAFEMVCWLLALGVRLEALRSAATAAQTEREALKLLASTDPLTGLLNRRALDAALEARLTAGSAPAGPGSVGAARTAGALDASPATPDPTTSPAARPLRRAGRRGGAAGHGSARPQTAAEAGAIGPPQALALFLLDLDGFKAVNDGWGHEAGDQLLRGVAQRLQQLARPGDIVARLGGDEFVLVITQPADAERVAQIGRQLLAQFDNPFTLADGSNCRVGATVGYALAPVHGRSAAELLRAADAAMYAGKQAGRLRLVAAA